MSFFGVDVLLTEAGDALVALEDVQKELCAKTRPDDMYDALPKGIGLTLGGIVACEMYVKNNRPGMLKFLEQATLFWEISNNAYLATS